MPDSEDSLVTVPRDYADIAKLTEPGITVTALVEFYEKRLMELFLLTPRQQGSIGGTIVSQRLTDLGMILCRNIETYRIDLETAKQKKS